MELRVAEAEDPAVGRHQPIALAVGGRGHSDYRFVEPHCPGGAVEFRVTEAEDAAVGGDEPVALPSGVEAIPTIGLLSLIAPVEPWNSASPKLKIPPSEATSQ